MTYELLTTRHPHSRMTLKNFDELLDAVIEAEPDWGDNMTSPYQPPLPHEYRHLLHRALAKDPDERFQTAAEFRARMQSAITGCFDVQCPVTFVKRTLLVGADVADRYPRLMVIAMLVAPLILLILLFLASQAIQ